MYIYYYYYTTISIIMYNKLKYINNCCNYLSLFLSVFTQNSNFLLVVVPNYNGLQLKNVAKHKHDYK